MQWYSCKRVCCVYYRLPRILRAAVWRVGFPPRTFRFYFNVGFPVSADQCSDTQTQTGSRFFVHIPLSLQPRSRVVSSSGWGKESPWAVSHRAMYGQSHNPER